MMFALRVSQFGQIFVTPLPLALQPHDQMLPTNEKSRRVHFLPIYIKLNLCILETSILTYTFFVSEVHVLYVKLMKLLLSRKVNYNEIVDPA